MALRFGDLEREELRECLLQSRLKFIPHQIDPSKQIFFLYC